MRWYGAMIALGFLCATYFILRLAKRYSLNSERLINLCLVCFIAGIIGARLYFVALNWDVYRHCPAEILATWLGGLSIHGGIIGGLAGGFIYACMTKLPDKLVYADIIGTVLPLAQSIGRWGNFFNSEAFGLPVSRNFPLGLFIAPGNRPFKYREYELFHPTFLYESLWDLSIFIILYCFLLNWLKPYPGLCFLCYIVLYSLGRLLIEPMRTDSIMAGATPVPVIASLVLLVMSLVLILIFVLWKTTGQKSQLKKEQEESKPK